MALTEIPIELSSTPSIVDGGNATAITIDSSENVGVGVAPIGTGLNIKANGNAYTDGALSLTDSDTDTRTYITHVNDIFAVSMNDGAADGILMTAAGAVTIANGLTLTDGNLVVAPNHGIDFSANGIAGLSAAGMSSELFEHYEEGTFTPVMNGLGTAGGTYLGFYTKIGRVLNWGCSIALPATSDTSLFLVKGLPYASLGGQGTTSDTNIGYMNTSARLQALVNAGTANLFFYADTLAAGQVTYASISGRAVYVGGSYFTA